MGLYNDDEGRRERLEKERIERQIQREKMSTEEEIRRQERRKKKMTCYDKYIQSCINSLWDLCSALHLSVDVRLAQLFEYTYAHILDKNFESFFNFLHVLPGAWSFYRYNFFGLTIKLPVFPALNREPRLRGFVAATLAARSSWPAFHKPPLRQ